MPRTRPEKDRAAKVEEILDEAERRLRAGEPLSMAGIARALDVAQNSIYWYFPSRDHLLVATLHRVSKQWLHELAALGPARYVEQILGAVDRLADSQTLYAAMRERAAQSEMVGRFATEFDASLCALLRETLRPHVPAARLGLAAETFLTVVQGALARDLPKRQRRKQLSFALAALTE